MPAVSIAAAEVPPVKFVTGSKFRSAITQPISIEWSGGGLRAIARQLEQIRGVSILLDRRLDPTSDHPADADDESLMAFLERLAAESHAAATVAGNTVYLGPSVAAGKLRTLVKLRNQELSDKTLSIAESRRTELTRGITFSWNDLDRPADLVSRLAEKYSLEIEGLNLVPHDLWGGAVLPDVTAIEALSLVLLQFDLTFVWIDQARGVRLQPIPERVALEQVHASNKGMVATAAIDRWKELIPELEARVEHGKIIVSGTVEMHELAERVRRGGRPPDKSTASEGPVLKPLKFQRYKLQIRNSPASALMKELGKPQHGKLNFEYDAAEIKAAGIDFEKFVTFEVNDATIEDLLKRTFEPLGVAFEVIDRTVKLKPAPK